MLLTHEDPFDVTQIKTMKNKVRELNSVYENNIYCD